MFYSDKFQSNDLEQFTRKTESLYFLYETLLELICFLCLCVSVCVCVCVCVCIVASFTSIFFFCILRRCLYCFIDKIFVHRAYVVKNNCQMNIFVTIYLTKNVLTEQVEQLGCSQ